MTRALALLTLCAVAAGCVAPPPRPQGVDPALMSEIVKSVERKPPPRPEAVEQALLPPLRMEMPSAAGRPIDPRFDLAVTNAPATQVFMSIASGTRYSMLVHPEVSGTITVSLKDVTIQEALESIRELYGYEYRIDGTRIFVQPAGLQTRVFQVNYLTAFRGGRTDVRVQSGAVTDAGPAPAAGAAGAAGGAAPGAAPGAPGGVSRSLESSRVTTEQQSDFWVDLRVAIESLVGIVRTRAPMITGGRVSYGEIDQRASAQGRSVVVTPQSGVVLVRAMPAELRAVEQFLRATRLSVERQVMLEAKIVEVTLAEGYQAGINWAAFRNSGPDVAVGQLSSSDNPATATTLGTRGQPLTSGGVSADTAARTLGATASALGLASGNPAGAVFGLALQTSNFAALLSFLEAHGSTQVLSSPRIATLNNQKAVLKVGTDEFFVTNVTTTSTATATATTQAPTVTVQPFFSGIVLDVTPQIDDANNIILHVHPSISEVTESVRTVNLGAILPEIRLPLAKSTVSESDTIVRVQDGNIVAIGGLMSVDLRDSRGGLPGVVDALRNTNRGVRKKELVILLKPTIIQSDRNWEQDLRETRGRFEALGAPPAGAQPGTPAK
jgi:MSHA biogenesis protein MshL